MAAQVVPFPATAGRLSLVADNAWLDAERAHFAAETAADIRYTIGEDMLPMLRTAHQGLSVMRQALVEIDRRHPLSRALLTEAELLGEVIAALQWIADPAGDTTDQPPPGAA